MVIITMPMLEAGYHVDQKQLSVFQVYTHSYTAMDPSGAIQGSVYWPRIQKMLQ